MTLGEKLEDARKRRGATLREASEATKVRAEYLQAYEENRTDAIPLPEVYIRGFLRVYGKFLRLDPEQLMVEFEATQPRGGRRPAARATPPREHRENMGRIELTPGVPNPDADDPRGGSSSPAYDDGPASIGGQGLWWKALLAAGSIILLIVVIVLVTSNLQRGGPTAPSDVSPTPGRTGSTARPTPPPATPANPALPPILLRAVDDVTVMVRAVPTGEQLLVRQLSRGESVSVPRNGPVEVGTNIGNRVEVTVGDRVFRLSQNSSPARQRVD